MFKLEIETGNEAMLTAEDIAEALQRVARRLYDSGLAPGSDRWINDLNGNRVGKFKYEDN